MVRLGWLICVFCLLAAFCWWIFHYSQTIVYNFEGVSGPTQQTTIAPPVPARWQDYNQGSDSRLAILLTDPDSAWLGLAHGLQTIGIPFVITDDYRQALRHKVVYVYPEITGTNMPPAALAALTEFAAHGGTLIAQHVLGVALKDVFGFIQAMPTEQNIELHFDPASPVAAGLTDPAEQVIRIGGKQIPMVGTYYYTRPKYPPVATYEDGSAAITRNATGTAYALGIDIGHLLLKGYSNRQQDIATHYVNAYEPTLDVLLRCLKNIYLQGEKGAVTLATVPEGKSLAVLLTHDIDYSHSLLNALDYASYERSHGITATYFMQVKYIRDWNDDVFFNDKAFPSLLKLRDLGMEIASHTVSHAHMFRNFPMGDGTEQYPSYVPFVKDRDTATGGTILGELRVSKFLLEHFIPGLNVVSFRPGHLSDPYALPQALTATHYFYSSSVTADDSLTHLPFQLTYGREAVADTPIYEFPLTIEDEADGPMINRLPQAIALADKLKHYGGLFTILIHPDVTGQKLDFEKGFVTAMGDSVWYGSMSEFGNWWRARNKVMVDVIPQQDGMAVFLTAPEPLKGLTLDVPNSLVYVSSTPDLHVSVNQNHLVIQQLAGQATLMFRQNGT